MRIDLRIYDTVVDDLTDTPMIFTQNGPATAVIIYADVDCCLSMQGMASTDDFLLQAKTYFVAHLDAGEDVSYIKADGASDGTIRLTRTD